MINIIFQRDVDKRVGCRGGGASELKDHPFYSGVDWNQVYQQRYPPPLIPPRGEVNAADAFDIGSFDEEDTKGTEYRKIIRGFMLKDIRINAYSCNVNLQ